MHDQYRDDYYDSQVFEYCEHLLANFVRAEDISGHNSENLSWRKALASWWLRFRSMKARFIDSVRSRLKGPLCSRLKSWGDESSRKGEIADGEKLSEWLYDKFLRLYGEHGYIQYTARSRLKSSQTNKSEGVVDFKSKLTRAGVSRWGRSNLLANNSLPASNQ